MPPEGDLGLVSTSDPVLSNGTGESVEVAAGPGARRGVGKCAGANVWLILSEESASAKRQESNAADLLSVGFSTRSTRI